MASKLFPASVFMLVLFCLLLVRETSGCNSASACFDANGGSLNTIQYRKMLSKLNLKDKKTILKASLEGSSTKNKNDEKIEIRELRMVPTGSNPLHNHKIIGELRKVPIGSNPLHNHKVPTGSNLLHNHKISGELRKVLTGSNPLHNHKIIGE